MNKRYFSFWVISVLLFIRAHLCAQANLQIALTSLQSAFVPVSLSSAGVASIKGVITNYGLITDSFVTVNWSVDGGVAYSETLTGLNLLTDSSYNFILTQTVAVPLPQQYDLSVWLTNPNGGIDEDTSDNRLNISVTGLGGIADKHVLFEEGTGSWCGFCPLGAYILDTLEQANPRLIGASLHNGDAMATNEDNKVTGLYISAYPGGITDRKIYNGAIGQDRDKWTATVAQALRAPTLASAGLYSSYDSSTRIIKAAVTTKFQSGLNSTYRVNVYVCENNVTGSGSGYDQQNNCSGNPNFIGTPYYNQPAVIVGFPHMRVIRTMLGGAWGSTGIVPASIQLNREYYQQYTDTLAADVNAANVFLIAIVQKYDPSSSKREIVNCIKGGLNGYVQTPVVYTYFTEDPGTVTNQNPLVFTHGDSLFYNGGYLVFQLGDTITINGAPLAFTSPGDTIFLYPGDAVTVINSEHGGSTVISAGQNYLHRSYGTYILNNSSGIQQNYLPTWSFDFSPNPANQRLSASLSLASSTGLTISLSNMEGQIIWNSSIKGEPGSSNIQIPTGNLSDGFYLLAIKSPEGIQAKRVIIMH